MRHMGWLAVVFAALALVLLAVVGFQAVMLYGEDWRPGAQRLGGAGDGTASRS